MQHNMQRTALALSVVAMILLLAIGNATSFIYGNARPAKLSLAPALTGQISQALAASTSTGKFTMPAYNHDYTLVDTKYFDDNDWVVTTINPIGNSMDRSVVVLEKQAGVYSVVLGPGSAFPRTTSLSMPGNLADYLNQKGMFYDATE